MINASEYVTATGVFTGNRQSVPDVASLPSAAAGCAWDLTGWYDPLTKLHDPATGAIVSRVIAAPAAQTLAQLIADKLTVLYATARGIRRQGVLLGAYGITIPTDDDSLRALGYAATSASININPVSNVRFGVDWVGLTTAEIPKIYQLACQYHQSVSEREYALAVQISAATSVTAVSIVDVTPAGGGWPAPSIGYVSPTTVVAPVKRTIITPARGAGAV